ncbi:MAG: Veg family protein [Clostridiales bacterium]|jgi:uncharacterized protein Veg|nr:Veg family protein [Clostridiales bacterium]
MFVMKDFSQLKRDMAGFVGSKVRLQSARGKQKPLVAEGVIDNVYPSIFTILLYEGAEPKRKVSFSYADLLTKAVELTICD